MSDEKDLEDHKTETNPSKYAKKYMSPNGEMEPLGFDPLTEEFQRRLEDRVNRFGVQTEAVVLSKENLQALFESLGVDPPNDFFKTNSLESTDISDENDKNEENIFNNDVAEQKNGVEKGMSIRYDAIHLHGVDEMSTKDIFIYLDEFPPKFVEWVNDSSCNVVYSDVANVCKVLLAKSKPYDEEEAVKTKKRKERHGEEEKDENDDDDDDMEVDEANNKDEKAKKERWRLGDAYTKACKLLMRFARVSDQKMGGRPHESNFYHKYGNPNLKIWTKNFKNKKNKKPDGDDDPPKKIDNGNDVGKQSGDDNGASRVTEDRINGSVKDRLGDRQEIRVRVSRSRSISGTRSRGQRTKRRSVEKYTLKTRSKVAMDDNREMTSFDRHVMEELEERKMRRGREGRRELWTHRKRHIEHDDDRAGSDDNDRPDNYSYRHGRGDYKPRRHGGYDDDKDRHDDDRRERDRGGVKSRLGEVKRSRVDDGGRRFDDKFGNSDLERRRFGDDDDDEGGVGDSYSRGRRNYDDDDDGYGDDVPVNKVKSSVFRRLGSRN